MKVNKLNWNLPGSIVPPLTVFKEGGSIDYGAMEQAGRPRIVDRARPR